MLRKPLFALGLAILTGCGSTVPLGSGDASGGSSGATGTGSYVCPSTLGAERATPNTAQMGDRCDDADSCVPGGCVAGGDIVDKSDPSRSGIFTIACANHHIQLVTSVPIDWSANTADAGAGASWSDCNSALVHGKSGDSCTWANGQCSRPTEDPCCIEIAGCAWFQDSLGRPPYGLVKGSRLCAPGCQKVTPDTTQPTVTDCRAASALNICDFAAPCQSGLVCTGFAGTGVPITDPSNETNISVAWCANGILVGNFFSTISDVSYF